jgi:hypothetical protein
MVLVFVAAMVTFSVTLLMAVELMAGEGAGLPELCRCASSS